MSAEWGGNTQAADRAQRNPVAASGEIDLSVIISTWNRCRSLGITLDALTKCVVPQKYRWELILVNNNSTDETLGVCRAFSNKLPIVYVEEPVQGLSVARNTGLQNASGKLIVFTDDDVTPCRNWLSLYLSVFSDKPDGYYFAGPVQSIFESDNINEELLSVAPASVTGIDYGTAPGLLGCKKHVLEVNWACPAESIAAVGAYDARWGLNPKRSALRTSEGVDLRARLWEAGLLGWYLPAARVGHVVQAKKCTLAHVSAYRHAQGFYCAASDRLTSYAGDGPASPPTGDISSRLTVAGAPLPLWMRLLSLAIKAIWREARGNTAYRERVYFRFYLGMIEGFRFKARKLNKGKN